MALQRTTAPPAPIARSPPAPSLAGNRAETAKSAISASTPSAHRAPIAVPLKPFAVQSTVEKL